MARLELEVTDELMGEIQAAAKACLVTPEHFATCRLSQIFRKQETSKWLRAMPGIVRQLADIFEGFTAEKKGTTIDEFLHGKDQG